MKERGEEAGTAKEEEGKEEGREERGRRRKVYQYKYRFVGC